MKNRRILALGSFVFVAAILPHAHATDLYWDADGAGAATGGTGLWNTASALWRLDTPAGALQTYTNGTPSSVVARFEGTAGTVTIPDLINSSGITFGTGVTGYNITTGPAAKMLAAVPAAGTFTVTTNGGANTLSADFQFPNANTVFLKTGPGTLFYPIGAGTSPNRGIYTVSGGTFDSQALIFDSILSMPAGNRLGTTGGANPVIPQVTLDAGTLQLTQTGNLNNLADGRGVQVTVNGGAIQDGGSEAFIPSYIKNDAGPSTGLYLSNIAGRTQFQGIISGAGNLTWSGPAASNIASFQAVNTYSGTTTINTGTIRLDFGTTDTGTTRLNSATAVTLNSGTLAMVGTNKAAQSSTQSVASVNVTGPFSGISSATGAAGLASNLNLGAITHSGLGTVGFTLPATGAITTTTANNAGGILGGWATIGNNWAASAGNGVTPGNISAYTGYLTTTAAGNPAANYLATSNVDVTSSPTLTGPVNISTLRFNTAAATNLTLTGANVINDGGILVGTAVGANNSAITGGTLTGSADGRLSVYQNNVNPLSISSQIIDAGGATTLLKSGTGSLTLSGNNTYTGGTRFLSGTLGVGGTNACGTGDITFLGSNTLLATASATLPNNIKLGLSSDVFDVGTNTLTLSGSLTNTSAAGNAVKAQGSGNLVLAGTFDLTGSPTNTDLPAIMLGNRNGANFNRGTLTITGTGSISRISTGWDNTANVLNIASTGTINMATDLVSGQSANGFGALNVSSGTINMQNLNMANWDGANGSFTMTGGTINTVNVRNGGTGNGNGNSYSRITGGTINVASFSTMSRQGNGTNILHIAGPDAQYNVGPGNFFFGFSGDSTGILTVDAGLVTAQVNMQLTNGNTANTFGIINLNGGVLNPNGIGTGGNQGKSIVNFDGGLLKARTGNDNFLTGLTQANIYDGGAKIDTDVYAITIAQPLAPATGSGIATIPVTTGGSGYLGIPVVKITGGGGIGATAVAIVSGGVVTGIQITSPGTGYSGTPTIALTAAGAITPATLGAATFATNAADGGLVKSGSGSLRLSGNNTYTGATVVNEGFLQAGIATNAFGINTAVSLADASGVFVDLNNFNNTIGSLTGGGLNGGDVLLGIGNLTVGANNTSPAAFGGSIIGEGGITKTGTGTLALAGNSLYTGDTLVNGGTFRLTGTSQFAFAITDTGSSDITVAATATADLDGMFNIDTSSVSLANGTWALVTAAPGGTITYGPDFSAGFGWTESSPGVWTLEDGLNTWVFTESNSLLKLNGGAVTNTYTTWINGFFPGNTNPATVGPNADPDNDGIRNAVEMVIGGNPATGMDTALMPTVELVVNPAGVPAGSYMLITYRRSDLSVASGLITTAESNTALTGTWTTAVDNIAGVEILEDDNYGSFVPPAAANTDRVRVYIPRAANTTLFGRLNVKAP